MLTLGLCKEGGFPSESPFLLWSQSVHLFFRGGKNIVGGLFTLLPALEKKERSVCSIEKDCSQHK